MKIALSDEDAEIEPMPTDAAGGKGEMATLSATLIPGDLCFSPIQVFAEASYVLFHFAGF